MWVIMYVWFRFCFQFFTVLLLSQTSSIFTWLVRPQYSPHSWIIVSAASCALNSSLVEWRWLCAQHSALCTVIISLSIDLSVIDTPMVPMLSFRPPSVPIIYSLPDVQLFFISLISSQIIWSNSRLFGLSVWLKIFLSVTDIEYCHWFSTSL